MRKRKILSAAAAIAMLAQSMSLMPTLHAADATLVSAIYASQEASVIGGAVYQISSVLSSKFLTAAEDGNVHQWEALSDSSQSWRIVALADGYCKILSAVNPYMALTVENADGTNGNNVYLAEDTGSVAQQFRITKDGSAYWISTRCSDGKGALDVYDISEENGANINQWEYWGGDGQKFRFIPKDSAYTFIRGDVTQDGVLDAFDLVLMKKGMKMGFDSVAAQIADVTCDGQNNVDDVKLMQDYLLTRVDSFADPYTVIPYTSPQISTDGRLMEYLDRGVVAVSTGNDIFVSWRLLATENQEIGFNVYRTTDGKTTKLNGDPLYGGTNFTDTSADLSKNNTYTVKAVENGIELEAEGDYTIPGNSTANCITIPIKPGGTIHFVWVGDFNGDGKYDYLVDRCADDHQKLEAYLDDGTYLWTIDLGYNSENKNNISPGASTIDVGMWDGATVYDMDCDGYSDIIVRIADGVTFGDGTVFSYEPGTNKQAIAVIDGRTGGLKDYVPTPTDYLNVGPLACMMEIGYLDGVNPSVICWMKNRNSDKTFNSLMCAYGYEDGKFVERWKFDNNTMFEDRHEYKNGFPEAHQIRVADVDYDGKDEVLHMGYALNGDGSLRYVVDNVVHGDRWYVGSFCNANNETEMFGYGIQQDNANGLLEYFYNASTGELLWEHYAASGTADVGRGNVGDIDPNYDGFECWSFQGTYSMNNDLISSESMYPVIRLWWDGDLLSESYNEGKIEEWDYNYKSTNRLVSTWKVTDCTGSDRGAPMFYGDILGDWREEVVMTSSDYSKLVIFTTTMPTDTRLYCLAQNPCYRNCMTAKGYYQSHMLDYFLGADMEMPTSPNIQIIEKK